MQVEMRMEEEGLGEAEAAEAVLRDNVFGLELDPRCTQIAAFALALAAWKRGGYRHLPVPNVACSGIPVQGQLETWLKLAGKDARLRAAIERLYQLFSNAPDLGSLINPADLPQNEMFMASYEEVAPVLEKALQNEHSSEDPVNTLFGTAVEGAVNAARLLAGHYILVVTNVPYLTSNKQGDIIKSFCEDNYPDGKYDLSTAFIDRCRKFTLQNGSHALVAPQNWLFLSSYKKFRIRFLRFQELDLVSRLGSGSKATASWEKLRSLTVITNTVPANRHIIYGIDALSG